jgi:hypothetical protein
MFYFMGLAKFAEPFFVLRVPGLIRDVRAWKATGIIYQRLGVQTVRATASRAT